MSQPHPSVRPSANLMATYPMLDTPSGVYDPQQQPSGHILCTKTSSSGVHGPQQQPHGRIPCVGYPL